jgi:hypothetical protein
LVSDATAIIIQTPKKIEKNIYKKEKENDLLQPGDEIMPVEPTQNDRFNQLEGFVKNH